MVLSNKQYNIIFLASITFILLIVIFKWSDYLVSHDYIYSNFKEGFDSNLSIIRDTGSPDTTHTVNLPLNSTYSCNNFCGPTSRCSITGQQCFADIDCPGCQPYVPPLKPSNIACVKGDNDAGKLTVGMTPTYSKLTTDIGTQSKIIDFDKNKKPAQPNFGLNTWIGKFNQENQIFNDRYKPEQIKFMPSYMPKYSMSGIFVDEGPLASNSNLSE
jgi:hypothetical protein